EALTAELALDRRASFAERRARDPELPPLPTTEREDPRVGLLEELSHLGLVERSDGDALFTESAEERALLERDGLEIAEALRVRDVHHGNHPDVGARHGGELLDLARLARPHLDDGDRLAVEREER